jgi:hypothetical protein
MLPATVGPSPDAAPFADLGAPLAGDPGVEQPFPRSAQPASPRGSVLPIAAWIVSLALLAVLIGAAYAWRAQIMASWPPSERLYAALGLAHPASRAISPQPER